MKRSTPTKPIILACDPSFTAWGWAVLQGNIVKATGVIVTKPEAKKRKIREGDDRARRTREIIYQLENVIIKYKVVYIVAEQPHGSQNAKAAIMMGVVVGIMESFNVLQKIPLEWYSEADAKKALLGRNSATKKQIQDGVDALYNVYWTGYKYVDEAVADSLAVYYAAECNSPTLKYLNR